MGRIDSEKKSPMSVVPTFIAPASFTDPAAALAQVRAIYDGSVQHLRGALQAFVAGDAMTENR